MLKDEQQLIALNQQAVELYNQGRIEEALSVYSQVLEIERTLSGEDSLRYANCLNTLGTLYYYLGRLGEAGPPYSQALETRRRILGEDHPDVIQSLQNLSMVYEKIATYYENEGKYTDAEPFYQRVIELQSAAVGTNNPAYANSLNNLALLYTQIEHDEKAEPLFVQALEIMHKAGDQHRQDSATIADNLAKVYVRRGDHALAKPLFSELLDARRSVLDKSDPELANILFPLAETYCELGDQTGAESLYLEALDDAKSSFGEDDPSYTRLLNDLGALYTKMERFVEAEAVSERALKTRLRTLGRSHLHYLTSLTNLARLKSHLGKHADAEPLWHQALESGHRILEEGDSDINRALNGLVSSYADMCRDIQRIPPSGGFADYDDHSRLSVRHKHTSAVISAVAFHPDGRSLTINDSDHKVRIWSLCDNKGLSVSANEMVASGPLVYDPTGRVFATHGKNSMQTITLWDAYCGTVLHELTGHSTDVEQMVFSQNGLILASTDLDGKVKLWDVDAGVEFQTLADNFIRPLVLIFSADSHFLTGVSREGEVRIWNILTGQELENLKTSSGCAVFIPGGRIAAVGGKDSGVVMWDFETGTMSCRLMPDVLRSNAIAISHDGQFLASGGRDGWVRIWEIHTGKEWVTFPCHPNPVGAVAFSQDGRLIVTGSDELTLRIWETYSGKEIVSLIAVGENDWVVLGPKLRYDASDGALSSLYMTHDWVDELELSRFVELRDYFHEPGLIAKRLGFSSEPYRTKPLDSITNLLPRLEFINGVPTAGDMHLNLFNPSTIVGRVTVLLNGTEVVSDARPARHESEATSLSIEIKLANHPQMKVDSENHMQVVICDKRGKQFGRGLHWWCGGQEHRPRRFEPELVTEIGPAHHVHCVAVSPDGKLLASGDEDMNIELRDMATGQLLRIMRSHSDCVTSLTFDGSGTKLASGSRNGEMCLWSVNSGTVIRTYSGLHAEVTAIAFRPEKGLLLGGSEDGRIVLWDVETGKVLKILETFADENNTSTDASYITKLSHSRLLAFSTDTQLAVVGHPNGLIRMWHLSSSQRLFSLEVSTETDLLKPAVVVFGSSDKSFGVGTALPDQFYKAFELISSGRVKGISAAPINPRLITCTMPIFDVRKGTKLRSFVEHQNAVRAAAFSHNGALLATAGSSGRVKIWEIETGKLIYTFESDSEINHLVFTPDGDTLVSGEGWSHFSGRIALRDLERSGIRTFERHIGDVNSIAFSPDGKIIAMAGEDCTIALWRVDAAAGPSLLKGHTGRVFSLEFSPDGALLASGAWDGLSSIWDVKNGEQVASFHLPPSVWKVAFSPDGAMVACACADGTINIWNVAHEQIIHVFGERLERFYPAPTISGAMAVGFSPDGFTLSSGYADGTVCIWNVHTGELLHKLDAHDNFVSQVCFSPDGRTLATGGGDQVVCIWDVATGKLLNTLRGHAVPKYIEKGTSMDFLLPKGEILASGGTDGILKIWKTETGEELSSFTGHWGSIASVKLSPDGRFLLAASNDASATLWDIQELLKPKKICSLYSFPDGSWAIIDGEGRFDASDGGDIKWMHWVVGTEPITLSQLKERYYEPGLLSKLFGYSEEAIRDVPTLRDVALYPGMSLLSDDNDDAKVRLHLTNRGGGIGRVVVSINGKEVSADARSVAVDAHVTEQDLEIDISGHPFLIPGQKNECAVRAYNADGYLVSRTLRWDYTTAEVAVGVPPQLWALLAGISDYQGDELDLRFAAKDAEDMAVAVRLGAQRLFGVDNIHLHLFITHSQPSPEGAQYGDAMDSANTFHDTPPPTHRNLVAALEEIARDAKSTDILFIYLAGHGVNHGGQDGDYYFLCADARTGSLEDPAVRGLTAISSQQLTALIQRIPALKQVLILDTCAAGRLVERLTDHRAISSSQARALDRMKDRMGMHILAGSAADAVSYESSRYGQGLLTYSMLLGMQGAALRDDEFIDVSRLFEFAADRVPELAHDIGGIQRPTTATPRGGASFDIGQLGPGDRQQIPLVSVRPLVLRARIEDELTFADHLRISSRVNNLLKDESFKGRDASMIFVDAAEHPDAFRLVGRYSVKGEILEVRAGLLQNESPIATFFTKGNLSDLDAFASNVLAQLIGNIQEHFAAVS